MTRAAPEELTELAANGRIDLLLEEDDSSSSMKLSELAIAGGTAAAGCSGGGTAPCHVNLAEEADLGSALQETLSARALRPHVGCTYWLPEVPFPGVFINPDDVVIHYYAGGTEASIALRRSNDQCQSGQWRPNSDLSMTILCETACNTMLADPLGRLEAYFGCIIPM